MKGLLFAVVLALSMQQPDEPYPGQGQHAKPPDGWYCEHQNFQLSVPAAHACNCERMCNPDTGAVIEDQKCTVFCHADHCHCTISNKAACK